MDDVSLHAVMMVRLPLIQPGMIDYSLLALIDSFARSDHRWSATSRSAPAVAQRRSRNNQDGCLRTQLRLLNAYRRNCERQAGISFLEDKLGTEHMLSQIVGFGSTRVLVIRPA